MATSSAPRISGHPIARRRRRARLRWTAVVPMPPGTASTPSEIVLAVRQIPEALPRDLVDRVTNGRLNGRGAIVAHADQPMPGREEANVDLRRLLADARQRQRVELVLDNVSVGDRGRL